MEDETKKQTGSFGKGGVPTPVSPGRPKGIPNKATQQAREAIGMFVDNNAWRLQGWLDRIADGIKSEDGKKYVVEPDPVRAFELFQSVIEYHVPKLQRTDTVSLMKHEHSGEIKFTATTVEEAERAYKDLIK